MADQQAPGGHKAKFKAVNLMLGNLKAYKESAKEATKLIQNYVDANRRVNETGRDLANYLHKMAGRMNPDPKLSGALEKMGHAQAAIEKLRGVMEDDAKGRLVEQLQAAAKSDPAKSSAINQLERTWKHTNELYNKKMAQQAKSAQSAKSGANLQEALVKMTEVARGAERWKGEMVVKVEQIHERYYRAILATLDAWFDDQYEYHGQSYAVLHELSPLWKEHVDHLKTLGDSSQWEIEYKQWQVQYDVWLKANK